MLAKQYTHRLPADYDMDRIRDRAAARGPLWDQTPGLVLKGFVARVRGEYGARGNAYASVYLWHDPAAAADFIMGERFGSVIDTFGRPRIESWLPIDARKGAAATARTLYREDVGIDEGTDHAALRLREIERNIGLARQADTLAVVTAIDLATWQLIRVTVSADAPNPDRPGKAYQVLHLAQPGVDALP